MAKQQQIPVKPARIESIDVLRGFALLGLLSMNIVSFSMPDIAYYNPALALSDSSSDIWIFSIIHVLADQKFMALFSLLFGASTILILRSYEKSDGAAKKHFSRNAWLVLFGFLHGILLWEGDVLLIYGLSAMLLYFLRNFAAKTLIITGLACYLIPVEYNLIMGWLVPQLDANSLQWLNQYWQPEAAKIVQDIALYQGPFYDQFMHRLDGGSSAAVINDGSELLGLGQLVDYFCRSLGMMLIGMGLFQQGVLSGNRGYQFYRVLMLIGFGVGIPLASLGLIGFYINDYEAVYSLFLGKVPNHIATLFIAAGYIGLIQLFCRGNLLKQLQHRLAAVGKLALTNYIAQTIIATFVFYGIGLGLYGQVSRAELLVIMAVIWLVQISFSVFWLQHFKYGPLEWLWRSLTQGRPVKIR